MKAVVVVRMVLVIATMAGASVAGAVSFTAPQGRFQVGIIGFEWEPDCRKPIRPYSGADRYAQEAYVEDVKRWARCVDSQAASDAKYAIDQIVDGQNEAVRKMKAEIARGY